MGSSRRCGRELVDVGGHRSGAVAHAAQNNLAAAVVFRQPYLMHALSGQIYPLIGAATRIGRLADNEVVFDDGESAATTPWSATRVLSSVITDLRSANGVVVQGRRIRGSVALAERDRIRIGQHGFVFEITHPADL